MLLTREGCWQESEAVEVEAVVEQKKNGCCNASEAVRRSLVSTFKSWEIWEAGWWVVSCEVLRNDVDLKYEVNHVVVQRQRHPPIEVCSNNLRQPTLQRAFTLFNIRSSQPLLLLSPPHHYNHHLTITTIMHTINFP